jgi:hypothetical protein
MKKIMILSLICTLYSSSVFGAYMRYTKNGGTNGYQYTSDVRSGNSRTITCKDPGNNSCPKSYPQDETNDPNLNTINSLLLYAISQIELGNLTGQLSMEGLTAIWNSDSPTMENSDIIIQ